MVVTDGFTGNILLKSSEAVAKLLVDVLRAEMTSSLRTKIGALLAKPAFGGIKRMMDPAEVAQRRYWASMVWYLSVTDARMRAPW